MNNNKPKKIFNLPQNTERRRNLRTHSTEPERRLWQVLRGRQLGVKFRRQHGIGPYIADFYCPERRLVIEVDGDSHFSPEGKSHDVQRDAYMCNLGLNVLRVSNQDVMQNLSGVVEHIQVWLGRSDPTPTLPLSGEGANDASPCQGPEPTHPSPCQGGGWEGVATTKQKQGTEQC